MFNCFKKLYALFKLVRNKDILLPPIEILGKLSKKRLPDKVFSEVKNNRIVLPIKTLFYLYDWLKYEHITRMQDGRYVINSFLPPMPGKGYSRMFENLLSGRKISPVSAYIAVTSKCIYDCWHCSYKNRNNDELTIDEIYRTIDDLVEVGVSIIGITGGEPILRNDIAQIVQKASSVADTMLFTNGFNFTEKLAEELKSAGLWAVAVSLDSCDPEVHNKKRNNSFAYEKAIEAVKICKQYGFYTMLTTVPDIESLKSKEYEKIYQLARLLNVDEYRIVEPMPTGKLICSDKFVLSDELRNQIRDFHRSINLKNLYPKVCAFAQVESQEYFGCCAGSMHLFIDSSGNVCPCDFTPLSFGNIKTEPFKECWNRLNNAFKLPRRTCFILENYNLISEYYSESLPLGCEKSLEVMKRVSDSDLPDYFKHVISQANQ